MSNTPELEVVSNDALGTIQRAEIDIQIATAKKYPRTMSKFTRDAVELATVDDEVAESCIYNRPVGKTGGVEKFAEGMSIRMAEIVSASYGNMRVGAMVTEFGERRVVARGIAHDLERNNFAATEVVESTVTRDGKPYSERQRAVIAKAAMAKARRDAIFQVVPRAVCRPVENAVRALLAGDGSIDSLRKRRERALSWTRSVGVPDPLVFATLGVQGVEDIGVLQLEVLSGLRTAIREGDTTIDEAFPMAGAKPQDGQAKPEDTSNAELMPEPKKTPPAPTTRPQEQLADIVTQAGHTLDDLLKWGAETGNIEGADTIASFDMISEATAAKLVKAKAGMLRQLGVMKKGGA